MTELHLPFLELAISIPLLGALWVRRIHDPFRARLAAVIFSGLSLVCVLAAWEDLFALHAGVAHDSWDVVSRFFGPQFLSIDELNVALLPVVALLYFLTILTTQRTKLRRFSFDLTLVTEAITLATFTCREPWGVVALLAIGTVPPYLELKSRNRPTRVYVLHMAAFVALLVVGWGGVWLGDGSGLVASLAMIPLFLAILIRAGMAPMHCWTTDFFEHASLGGALLHLLPITGAYGAVRLLVPFAPDWLMWGFGLISLATAVYAAGMALVQREVRRFFCYIVLSNSALVLVGLEVATPLGLTGALCVWISVGLSLGGLGLTLRALEARFGRLSLTDFHGLYEHTPTLAVCFALTGLASVGFPGTLGFIGTELLIDGAMSNYPYAGVALIFAATLNGIAAVRAYFLLFTGARHVSSVSLQIRGHERFAVLTLAGLLLGGSLVAAPWVASRHHAAEQLLHGRQDEHTLPGHAQLHPETERREQADAAVRL